MISRKKGKKSTKGCHFFKSNSDETKQSSFSPWIPVSSQTHLNSQGQCLTQPNSYYIKKELPLTEIKKDNLAFQSPSKWASVEQGEREFMTPRFASDPVELPEASKGDRTENSSSSFSTTDFEAYFAQLQKLCPLGDFSRKDKNDAMSEDDKTDSQLLEVVQINNLSNSAERRSATRLQQCSVEQNVSKDGLEQLQIIDQQLFYSQSFGPASSSRKERLLKLIQGRFCETLGVVNIRQGKTNKGCLQYLWKLQDFYVWKTFEDAFEDNYKLYINNLSVSSRQFYRLIGLAGPFDLGNYQQNELIYSIHQLFFRVLIQKKEYCDWQQKNFLQSLGADKWMGTKRQNRRKYLQSNKSQQQNLFRSPQLQFGQSERAVTEALSIRNQIIAESKGTMNPVINIVVEPSNSFSGCTNPYNFRVQSHKGTFFDANCQKRKPQESMTLYKSLDQTGLNRQLSYRRLF